MLSRKDKAPHGLYSSKVKGNDKGSDNFGKPYVFIAGGEYDAKVEKRDCYKGKQIITGSHVNREATEEGKKHKAAIAYVSEPFDDNPTVEKVRKLGFSTVSGGSRQNKGAQGALQPHLPPPSLPAHHPPHPNPPPLPPSQGRELSRDDLSSTVQILRYRHHLLGELKTEAKHAAASPPRAQLQPSATQLALAASQALRTTTGLKSVIPTFTNEFDRQRYVPEFSTRTLPPAVRHARVHGSTRPISTDIGEACCCCVGLGCWQQAPAVSAAPSPPHL
jgi:hypothetical protein